MAGVIERSGKWYATFRINGTTKRVNTGVPIEQKGRKASHLEAEARQKAAVLEQRAKGLMNHSTALDALRSVERIHGAGGSIPTVREYLTNYRGQATEKTESNKKRAAKMFLEYIGKGADIRLDALTRQTVQDFIPWALQRVAVGTVELMKGNLATMFNAAVDDEILTRSPMPRRISVSRLAASVNPEIRQDEVKRQPFTREEMHRLIYDFPQPWADMALCAFSLGALRLGDTCCLRWSQFDFSLDEVTIKTGKTGATIHNAIPAQVKARLLARRETLGADEEYLFPDMARRYLRGAGGSISTEFTALLKAYSITRPMPEGKLKGNRKRVSPLSFHSIRHTACSGRVNANIAPDVMRAMAAHSSEEIERLYTHADISKKRDAVEALLSWLDSPREQ